MPHLLNVWPTISSKLRIADRLLLLFDYDGTLTPIVPHPDQAVLAADVKDALANLAKRDRYIVGIVSGRSLEDVGGKVGIPDIIYAGNHGLEIRGPRVEFTHPDALRLAPTLEQVYAELKNSLGYHPGVTLENKALSLSVHTRTTPDELVPTVEKQFLEVVSPYVDSGQVKTTRGKRVLEVRPNVAWDKGKAINRLMEIFPEASLTAFFGDDVTDEDGFEVVQAAAGLAVFVGAARQPTTALYRVDSPQEVLETLRLLARL